MNYTTEDLAIEVMRLPNWIGAQETPDAADAAYIRNVYGDLYKEWKLRGIAYWADVEAIPQEVFRHIVRIIVDSVAPSFGDAAPTEFDIETGVQMSMGKKGWNGLKRVTGRQSSGLPAQAQYF